MDKKYCKRGVGDVDDEIVQDNIKTMESAQMIRVWHDERRPE